MKKFLLVALGLAGLYLVTGCQSQNNISVTTNNGECANGLTDAPYCISVTMHNNSGGQNFISSTNAPFTNVTVAISGVSNVLSPSSTELMDPNGCTSNSIAPGGSCKFYLQLNQEVYAVGSVTPFVVTINYSVSDGLSSVIGGGSSTQSSYSFTLNQYANLYSVQHNGDNNLTVYNNGGINYYTLESTSGTNILSANVDNSSYGYLWLGTNQGMYWFGNGNTSGNTMYNPSDATSGSISNIFTSQPSPFESQTSTPAQMYGVVSGSLYSFTFATNTWGSQITVTPSNLLSNVNAVAVSGSSVVLASTNQVYACSTASSGASCSNEASAINGVTDVGFTDGTTIGYTGLYAGTNAGLYAESGIFPSQTNSWVLVTGDGIESAQITAVTTDDVGGIYAGDASGNVWLVSAATQATVAQLWVNPANLPISSMVFDNVGHSLYLTSGSGLYQCPLSGTSCQNIGNVGNTNPSAGLVIGSSISS